jgi:hypothetical protein
VPLESDRRHCRIRLHRSRTLVISVPFRPKRPPSTSGTRSSNPLSSSRESANSRSLMKAHAEDVDVLLCPPMPTVAFPHDHSPQVARQLDVCESAWNKDPVFGVIGIQSGPPGQWVHSGFHGGHGSQVGDAGEGADRGDPRGVASEPRIIPWGTFPKSQENCRLLARARASNREKFRASRALAVFYGRCHRAL